MRLDDLGRRDSWEEVSAVVAGFGVSGFAAADNLTHLGARVVALDEATSGEKAERAQLLEILGADVRLGPGSTATLPDGVDVVVTSPGWRPDAALLVQARERGIPVWGEVELAWRLRDPEHPAPWLVVTGTNGKTTTTSMLHAMLVADGRRAALCGNIGRPVIDVLGTDDAADFLAIELSSFQLYWAPSVRPVAGAVLNVAEDHLDWHGSMAGYAAAKAVALSGRVAVAGIDDPTARDLLEQAPAPVKVGFTLDEPQPGQLGVSDGMLVDRAFADAAPLAHRELQCAKLPYDWEPPSGAHFGAPQQTSCKLSCRAACPKSR